MINLSTFTPHVQPEEAKALFSSPLHPTITKRLSEIFQTSYPRRRNTINFTLVKPSDYSYNQQTLMTSSGKLKNTKYIRLFKNG